MPVRPKKPRQSDQDSFSAVAKRLGCDEDKGRFEAKLGKIAKANLDPSKAAKARKR